MNLSKFKPDILWSLIIPWLAIVIATVGSGVYLFSYQRGQLINSKIEEISSVADMKVRLIIQWRQERLGDGKLFSESTLLGNAFQSLVEESVDVEKTSLLQDEIRILSDVSDFKSTLFVDTSLNVKLFYPAKDTIIGDFIRKELPGIIRKGEIVMTDIHQTGKVSFTHLDVVVPIHSPQTGLVFGALLMRIDPGVTLYQILREWPSESKSAETCLLHNEDGNPAYLFRNEDNLGIPVPIDDNLVLETSSVQKKAIDYRGKKVISVMRKVPETNWYLLAKIDREEIFEQVAGQERIQILAIILFVLAASSVMGVIFWNRRGKFYREQYFAELERMAISEESREILRQSEEKFRKIFEESPFSMVMTGKDFGILRVNNAFCKFIGKDSEEIVGKTYKDFTHPDHLDENEVSLMRLTVGELPVYHVEKRYLRADGTVLWGSTTITVIRNSKEEIQFYFAMIEDITSRRLAEAELLAAKEKAEESDRLKTAFLHNVSHEIRTPMNAIMGFTSLLSGNDLSRAEREQYLEIISESGNQLLLIINDILDLASIESGQMKLSKTRVDLNKELALLAEQFRYKEKSQSVALSFWPGLKDSEAVIITDRIKLLQILSNLINNSFKFTSEGTIEFGYTADDKFVEFFVKDTGIGIPGDQVDRIFDRFFQVDNAISRKYSGAGLGLSICKAYTELLGGSIRIESETGKGSTFRVVIPFIKS